MTHFYCSFVRLRERKIKVAFVVYEIMVSVVNKQMYEGQMRKQKVCQAVYEVTL